MCGKRWRAVVIKHMNPCVFKGKHCNSLNLLNIHVSFVANVCDVCVANVCVRYCGSDTSTKLFLVPVQRFVQNILSNSSRVMLDSSVCGICIPMNLQCCCSVCVDHFVEI